MTIQEQIAARAATADAFEALVAKMAAEGYEDAPADETEYERLKAEIDKLDKKIARTNEATRIKAAAAKPVDPAGPAKTYPMPKRRYGKLRAFFGEQAEENAYRSGMFVLASIMGNETAIQWCRDNGVVFTKAQSEGINTAGGFLVPTEMETAIIDLRETYGVFRGECRVVPMGRDKMDNPRRAGGVTAYWVGENQQITESQKGWDNVSLVAKKLAALTRISNELAEDAIISIADDLTQEMAYAFAKAEDAAGWNGDGTSSHGGIVGVRTKIIDGSHDAGKIVAASNHDTFAEIDATDLATLMAALPKYAEANAKWYCSQVAWSLVFQRLIAAAGGNSIDTLTGGRPRRVYLGYEVVTDQSWPTATTDISGTAMIGFGDLRLAARLGDRRGIAIATSDDRYFENDQIGIKATERVDINVHDLGDNTNPGPFVCLIGQ